MHATYAMKSKMKDLPGLVSQKSVHYFLYNRPDDYLVPHVDPRQLRREPPHDRRHGSTLFREEGPRGTGCARKPGAGVQYLPPGQGRAS